MKKYFIDILVIVPILLLALVARTYHLDAPLADWHSWRQADTAAVARNFAREGIDFLRPQTDSLQPMNEYGLDNPERLFINEFPLYNALVALVYRQFGINHVYARVVSIIFATMGTFFLYLLARKLFTRRVAALAALYYAVNPYNVYYGRVVMPDPLFVALSITAVYLAVRWVESKKLVWGLAFMLAFGLAMLVKPYAVFLALPLVFWVFVNWRLAAFRSPQTYLVAVGALLPLLLWRRYVSLHPEGTFATTWLFNGGDIRFTGAFFRWLIFERLNRLIFATGGFVLFVVGLVKSYQSKSGLFIFFWLLSVAAYMTIFAKGNVTHDYYQLPIMPAGAILVSLGFFALVDWSRGLVAKILSAAIGMALLVLSLAFGWYEVRGYYNINNPAIVAAGAKAAEILPPDALVIAPYQTDPAFLYQTNRFGWPTGGEIETKIARGAQFYITTAKDDEFHSLAQRYPVIYATDAYAIIKLSDL